MPALTAETLSEVNAAHRQALNYCRARTRWLDREELAQELWAAIYAALPLFDDGRGTPLGAYLYRAAVRAGHDLAWRLTGAAHVPFMKRHAEKLIVHRTAAVDVSVMMNASASTVPADEQLAGARRREVIASVVAEHLAANNEGDAVRAVLYGIMPPREAADAFGVDVRRVYRSTAAVRSAMKNDRRILEVL